MQTGRYAPVKDITFNLQANGSYRDHHIVFKILQASHFDQTYMWCVT